MQNKGKKLSQGHLEGRSDKNGIIDKLEKCIHVLY